MHSPRSMRELFYDGKTVSLYTPAQKYYSSVEFSGTNGELIEKLRANTAWKCRWRISLSGVPTLRPSTRLSPR